MKDNLLHAMSRICVVPSCHQRYSYILSNIVHTAKIEIMCQVVAYKRLKTMRIINRQAQKVVG